MPSLSPDRIAHLLDPYLGTSAVPETLFLKLATYLDLLLKWNARTNLTAIRDPETIVTRHFGESLFLARHLPPRLHTVLDLGSGAGFPGIPLHLLRPDLEVTLAESQHKKAAFLREVIRHIGLSTQVHAGRAEDLVGKRHFDVVVLRAVDRMEQAMDHADSLGEATMILSTSKESPQRSPTQQIPIPQTAEGVLQTFAGVPRGTRKSETVPRGTGQAS